MAQTSETIYRRRGVDIRSAFDMYDLSKTGFVSRRDFREAMRKLQVGIKKRHYIYTRINCAKSRALIWLIISRPLVISRLSGRYNS